MTTHMPPSVLDLATQLGYANHVFISWPHDIEAQGVKIVRKLAETIEDKLKNEGKASVYLDVNRLKPGYVWNNSLRTNLCRSAVTVVIVGRKYFESPYCRIEWAITEEMQRRRLPEVRADRTCFIPILLSRFLAPRDFPRELSSIQMQLSFSDLLVYGRSITSHPRWLEWIDGIVRQILDMLQLLTTKRPEWDADERFALAAQPKEFTWDAPAPAAPPPPAPRAAVTVGRTVVPAAPPIGAAPPLAVMAAPPAPTRAFPTARAFPTLVVEKRVA